MQITALVENQTNGELKAKHGLSLYIETTSHKLLFDLGSNEVLFANAQAKHIDLSQIDTVIISHGHLDHGGALESFLKINHTAKIYVQRQAFAAHYSQFLLFKIPIGLDHKLADHPQIILLDGDHQIDHELSLFTVKDLHKCHSSVNDTLYDQDGRDTFQHEQNLIIQEQTTALVMGCGHAGIINILAKAQPFAPQVCIGGYHLYNPITQKTVSQTLLKEIAQEMQQYAHIQFYTCHCTGKRAFQYLSQHVPKMTYLSCGSSIACPSPR